MFSSIAAFAMRLGTTALFGSVRGANSDDGRMDACMDAFNSVTDGGTLHLQPNLKVKACSKETPPCKLVSWRGGSGWRRPKSASWRTKGWCGRAAGPGRATANMTRVRLKR